MHHGCLDWYKANTDKKEYAPAEDPGVVSVSEIYEYYKQHGYETVVMGASFRSIDQVLGLAGCDLLTVAPNLLAALEQDTREVKAQLSASDIASTAAPLNSLSETEFRDQIEHDLMATQLLQGGIDGFIKARQQLNTLLRQSFGLDEEISA